MSFRLWGSALLQRILLFIMAGLVAVALLHVPAGVSRGSPNQKTPPTYSSEKWMAATGDYLRQVVQGDLGALKPLGVPGYKEEQPVSGVIWSQAPRSAGLLGIALGLSLILGTVLGFLSSRFIHRMVRTPVLTGVLFLLSFPDILMIFLLRAFVLWTMTQFGVQILSTGTFGAFELRDLITPAMALTAMPLVLVARVASVAFDEAYAALYVRTAHSKGLHPLRVVLDHVLKNAWIQVADAGPLIVGSLVTGLVVVEYAFYFPGVGRTLGLMLERGGQPGAASSFALVLLLGAILTDTLFGAIRLALDPRRKEREASRGSGLALFRLPDLRALSPLGFLRGLLLWVKDLPYTLGQAAWTLRPSHLFRSIWRNPPLLVGLIGLLGLVSLALFGGQLADLRNTGVAPKYILHDGEVFFPPFRPGLTGYPLGSDMAGRDMLSRLLVGARYTLFFTLAVTPVRLLFALPWGLAAGYAGGIWTGSSRSLSLMFAAIPVMLIPAALLPVQAALTGGSSSTSAFWLVTLILAVVGIPRLVESIRQQVESTLVQPFVEGARATGATSGRILTKHVLPHLAPQLWVAAAADMAWTLLLLAQLGVFSIYLGGGVSVNAAYGERGGAMIPRLPDWSAMLSKPYDVIYRAPWAVWVPAVAFLLAIVIFNLLAEGLRRQAQQLTAGAQLPEPEVQPDGTERIPARARRRLALEWTAAALVIILALGTGFKYGRAEAPPQPKEMTPLQQARASLQQSMDTVYGTGDQYERARAVPQVRSAVDRYLARAFEAKLNAADIQTDTRGRINLFPLEGVTLYQFQVPPGVLAENAFNSFLWIQDASGSVNSFNTSMKPVYAVAKGERLVVAGTVPGPDNWEIHFYTRESPGRWVIGTDMAVKVEAEIPKEWNAELVTGMAKSPRNQIILKGGPLNSARVGPNGDLTICKSGSGPCMTVKFEEYAK